MIQKWIAVLLSVRNMLEGQRSFTPVRLKVIADDLLDLSPIISTGD